MLFFSSFQSFSSDGEPSELSRHIRGVVEVEGPREQNGLLKIKAELDTYQREHGRKYHKKEPCSTKNKVFLRRESSIKNSLQKFQKRNHLKRSQTQPAINLDTFIENPNILLHRARTVSGMNNSKSTPATTSKLGQLVESNARRGSLFF